ncbi:MAG: hypothetical protein ACR2OT_01390 [Parvibaculales bacterium]
MYKLTPRMLQRFERDLRKYHDLLDGGRCSGWEQEELIVNAIKSDTVAQHQVYWREAGHDDKADITVKPNGRKHLIQIKSGKEARTGISISGHRLGRFEGDFKAITEYLNNNSAHIISVRYRKVDDDAGRKHIYQLCYLDVRYLTNIAHKKWKKQGTTHEQVNDDGVVFSLRPKMSWQIWWKVPLELFEETPEIVIG